MSFCNWSVITSWISEVSTPALAAGSFIVGSHNITVRVLKHDGAEHRRWSATLSRQDGDLIVLDAEFDVDVTHEVLGRVKKHTRTVEYYWLDRWYSIFRFLTDDGSTRLWYCNVNTPPEVKHRELIYIDLDIDIVVQPDFSFQVLDTDEFETNARRYGYSDEERRQAEKAVEVLFSMIETRQFPFTGLEPDISERMS
jgi:protein associated with RNAse G/E